MAARSAELVRFVQLHVGVEAVLQRCGEETFDLVLVDVEGNWNRWVYTSEAAAAGAADRLDVPLHRGWDDRMARRMNRRDHWNDQGGQRRAL
jgi:hypothetical protein